MLPPVFHLDARCSDQELDDFSDEYVARLGDVADTLGDADLPSPEFGGSLAG
jgi:hypothetical protein